MEYIAQVQPVRNDTHGHFSFFPKILEKAAFTVDPSLPPSTVRGRNGEKTSGTVVRGRQLEKASRGPSVFQQTESAVLTKGIVWACVLGVKRELRRLQGKADRC